MNIGCKGINFKENRKDIIKELRILWSMLPKNEIRNDENI